MIKIAPSILSADFAYLARDIEKISTADYVHVDVMDGLFVPNISIGIPVVKSIRPTTALPLDVHLMIEKPVRYIEAFAKAIGAEIDSDDEQLRNGHGYDHNWVLATAGDLSRPAARLVSPVSGIALEVFTDEPGIQVYVGNFLDGTVRGKHGIPYAHRTAVCLETQHYPDSPNKPQWPSVVLRPGETYHSRCIYRFSVDK